MTEMVETSEWRSVCDGARDGVTETTETSEYVGARLEGGKGTEFRMAEYGTWHASPSVFAFRE
jgi:hypothetical protein